jgi:lysylphosphatidylglycerol synthetase-like protein (DUF2156 family)
MTTLNFFASRVVDIVPPRAYLRRAQVLSQGTDNIIRPRKRICRLEELIMQWLFLLLAILGTILPLAYLVPFLAAHGLDVPLIFRQLFQTNISAFFGLDVVVSGLALLVFVASEGRRRGMKRLWVYVLCTLLVGVSLGLPLFLFVRERRLAHEENRLTHS